MLADLLGRASATDKSKWRSDMKSHFVALSAFALPSMTETWRVIELSEVWGKCVVMETIAYAKN